MQVREGRTAIADSGGVGEVAYNWEEAGGCGRRKGAKEGQIE